MSGEPLLLLHAGGMDARMWDPLRAELGAGFDARAPLLTGGTPAQDVVATLPTDGAVLVGASWGGNVALQVATAAPERVRGLVLLAASMHDGDPSPELAAYWAEEERLVEAGDLDAAVQLSVRTWVRDPRVAAVVADMCRDGYERDLAEEAAGAEYQPLPIDLAAIRAPAIAASGGLDHADFAAFADRIATDVAGARREVVPDAGHLIALERPRAAADLIRSL